MSEELDPSIVSDATKKDGASEYLVFEKNNLLSELFGEQDKHLAKLETGLHVNIYTRGNAITIKGAAQDVATARNILQSLYNDLDHGRDIDMKDIDAGIRMVPGENEYDPLKTSNSASSDTMVKTRKRLIKPYSNNQRDYIRSLNKNELVLSSGPAGTGKTYLAVAVAVSMFQNGKVDRIILSRPAVEAGEKLGFLPGDMKEKVDPYLRPLYDALYDMLPSEQVITLLKTEQIEIAPLAFMRGRTLNNAFIILDEAQNATPTQMKMFLTRLGEGSRMVINGDLTQTDLPRDVKSGLRDALEKLKDVEGISCIRFNEKDVIRHPLTARIVQAYEASKGPKWTEENN